MFYNIFKFKEFTETNTCLQSTVQSVNGKCRNSNYNSGSVGRKTTLIMAQHREYKPENRTTIVCLQPVRHNMTSSFSKPQKCLTE